VRWEYLHRTSMNASCELEPNAGTSDTRLPHESLHIFAAVLCIAGVCTHSSSITLTNVMVLYQCELSLWSSGGGKW
jgi:hypothetical protein